MMERKQRKPQSWSLLPIVVTMTLLLSLWSLPVQVSGLSSLALPEDVVQMQLAALQDNDIRTAYSYNSKENQGVTGSWQEFGELLKATRSFRPILGHHAGHVLLTVSHGDNAEYVNCLVKIVTGTNNGIDEDDDGTEEGGDAVNNDESFGPSNKCSLYWWEVSRQPSDEEDEIDASGYKYAIDSIMPDADDVELDLLDMPTFFIDDDDAFDDDDDDPTFFLDM
jgi:hypothetical protein